MNVPIVHKQEGWPTPRRLHAHLVSTWCLALLFCGAVAVGTLQRRHAVQTIGKDAAPSIIAAQQIKASLADMDANVVNELLVRPGENASSIKGYHDRREEVIRNLILAAENITYGDAERTPIRTFALNFGEYEEKVSRARTLHERGDAAAITVYREADALLQQALYPELDALSKANNDALTTTYNGVEFASTASLALLVLTGAALLTALLATQVYLNRKMRRLFNVPLLAATVLTLWLLVHTFSAFQEESKELVVVRQDAFTSIEALLQAHAIAYDANTDESRWLLDRAQAATYQDAFFRKSEQLVTFPTEEMYDRIASATAQGKLPSGAKGLIADELNNITFSGEQEAATEMLKNYGVYFALDKEIRRLENDGKHTAAIQLDISMEPGQSNWAFSRFDDSLSKTVDINQKAFDNAVTAAFAAVHLLDVLAVVAAVLLIGAVFAGLLPRIREYAL